MPVRSWFQFILLTKKEDVGLPAADRPYPEVRVKTLYLPAGLCGSQGLAEGRRRAGSLPHVGPVAGVGLPRLWADARATWGCQLSVLRALGLRRPC